MKYEITANEAFKSFEISFDEKPSEAVRDALKALRYRWHSVKKIWYGYSDEKTVREAIENAEGVKAEKKVEKKAVKVNKYGVKVGDVFEMSWGYEQTQVDFFQVVSLAGESSVRVVNVNPVVVGTKPTCPMAEDRTWKITKELMPIDTNSIFINDNVKGDLKKVDLYGGEIPSIKIKDHYANKIGFGEFTGYVSWYY